MKSVIRIGDVYTVVSEPGDMTRYEYVCVVLGHKCKFINDGGTIDYPIDIWFTDLDKYKTVNDCPDDGKVNPYTFIECVRTMREILNDQV